MRKKQKRKYNNQYTKIRTWIIIAVRRDDDDSPYWGSLEGTYAEVREKTRALQETGKYKDITSFPM